MALLGMDFPWPQRPFYHRTEAATLTKIIGYSNTLGYEGLHQSALSQQPRESPQLILS
jgi:hypothetical protein